MENITINVPFPAHVDCDNNGFAYIDDSRLSACCYGPTAKAKRTLKQKLAQAVDEALEAKTHERDRNIIFCADGTVLLVEYRYGAWGYSITDSTRKHSASCSMPKGYQEAYDAAVAHAAQSYGGVVGVSSI